MPLLCTETGSGAMCRSVDTGHNCGDVVVGRVGSIVEVLPVRTADTLAASCS
jgi:hypothetical protein